MENVILIIHLILAVALIGVVLLQRSEGGGLGTGGGGGVMSSRAAATSISKLTWILGGAFLATSLTLTIVAASNSANTSLVDRLSAQPAPAPKADLGLDPSNPLGLPGEAADQDGALTPSLE